MSHDLRRRPMLETLEDRTVPSIDPGFVTANTTAILWVGAVATVGLAAAATQLRLDPSIAKLQAQTAGAALEREVAVRFSLPQDVLLVLNDHDDIEPLLDADRRLARALAAQMPGVAANGIAFMLPSARGPSLPVSFASVRRRRPAHDA